MEVYSSGVRAPSSPLLLYIHQFSFSYPAEATGGGGVSHRLPGGESQSAARSNFALISKTPSLFPEKRAEQKKKKSQK